MTQPPTDAARAEPTQAERDQAERIVSARCADWRWPDLSKEQLSEYWLAVDAAAAGIAATRQQPEEGEALWRHFERMQDMMRRYIEPITYVASFPADGTRHASEFEEPGPYDSSTNAESKRRRMDRAFISDMIHMMDGPKQRALAATRLAEPARVGREEVARIVAQHWPNGCWWQPDGTYAGSTESGHSYEGARFDDAVSRWSEQVADRILSLLSHAEAGGVEVPSGWKLVPVEPTEAMWRASTMKSRELCAVVWSAMLAASPAAVEGGEA